MSTTREKMIERGARAIAALPGGDTSVFDPAVVWLSPEALAAAVIDAIGGEEMAEALHKPLPEHQAVFEHCPRCHDARSALAKATGGEHE